MTLTTRRTDQGFMGGHLAAEALAAELLSAIPQDPGGDALLTYSALVHPDPAQVNAAAWIRLTASNGGSEWVTVQSIEIRIPVGSTSKELTRSAEGIEIDVPAGWLAEREGGAITLTPTTEDAARVGGKAVGFVISGLTVNGEAGPSVIEISETASSNGQPPAARGARLTVSKFPEEFHLSELTVSPLEVAAGGAATLDWTGTATGATYTLEYQPADEGTPVSDDTVGSSGPYVAKNLTRRNAVHFRLTAKVKLPGRDAPIVAWRTASVDVATLSLELSITPAVVAPNGLARLRWSTSNALSCTLDPGGVALGKSGERYVVITPAASTFTVVAHGSGGVSRQEQRAATIDPTIRPTESGVTITGVAGGKGRDVTCSDRMNISPHVGGRGGDAVFRGPLAPLQETGRPGRVVTVALTGGAGGRGGDGGWCFDYDDSGAALGVSGVQGGDGGDARLEAEIDASLPAAQYIVTLTPGEGGPGGTSSLGAGAQGLRGEAVLRITAPRSRRTP